MRTVLVLMALTLSLVSIISFAQQPATNPLSSGARLNYQIIKGFITGAAEKMPDANYAFQPTPDIRKFSELVAHLADANYRVCSIVGGQEPMDAGIERSNKTAKADLTKALAESFAYCDKLYAGMNDTVAAEIIRFDAGGEGLRVPLQMPKLTALAFHVQHAFEHYGNMVTYMRLKNVVPPSSQIAPPAAVRPATASSNSSHSDISGDWILNVDTPNGPVVASLNVKKDGNRLNAEAKWDRGIVALTGMLSSDEIRLEGQMQTLKITFTGKPGTESMSGKVDFVGHPSGTWTATRQ